MLWLKAFHIVFVVAWFAGLFYLPRLFVYHVNADPVTQERLKIMERKLFAMMTLGAVLALLFAFAMLDQAPGLMEFGWMKAKLSLVILLLGYHSWCFGLMRTFRNNRNRHSERWYRLFNELPTLFLVAIVILVVVKPF